MGKDHLRFIRDSLLFILCLGLVLFAKLLLVLFALAEAVGMVWVCYASVCRWDASGHARWLLVPVAAMIGVGMQGALWQFWWQRIAGRGSTGRALAECFAITLRHPVVRPPHEGE